MILDRAEQDLARAASALKKMRDATTSTVFRAAVNRFVRASRGVVSSLEDEVTDKAFAEALHAVREHALSGPARLRATATTAISAYEMRFEHAPLRAAILVCADYFALLQGLLAAAEEAKK